MQLRNLISDAYPSNLLSPVLAVRAGLLRPYLQQHVESDVIVHSAPYLIGVPYQLFQSSHSDVLQRRGLIDMTDHLEVDRITTIYVLNENNQVDTLTVQVDLEGPSSDLSQGVQVKTAAGEFEVWVKVNEHTGELMSGVGQDGVDVDVATSGVLGFELDGRRDNANRRPYPLPR